MTPEKYLQLIDRKRRNRIRSYKRHLTNLRFKPELRLREFLNEIRVSNRMGSHVNCIRINPINSKEHERMKFEVCMAIQSLGHDFFTECIFWNGKRADVIDLYSGVIYEIVKSEKENSLLEKRKTYPEVFEIISIDATKEFKEGDIQ